MMILCVTFPSYHVLYYHRSIINYSMSASELQQKYCHRFTRLSLKVNKTFSKYYNTNNIYQRKMKRTAVTGHLPVRYSNGKFESNDQIKATCIWHLTTWSGHVTCTHKMVALMLFVYFSDTNVLQALWQCYTYWNSSIVASFDYSLICLCCLQIRLMTTICSEQEIGWKRK